MTANNVDNRPGSSRITRAWLRRVCTGFSILCFALAIGSYFGQPPAPRPSLVIVNPQRDLGEIPVGFPVEVMFQLKNQGLQLRKVINLASR